jgi:hypothetical protein
MQCLCSLWAAQSSDSVVAAFNADLLATGVVAAWMDAFAVMRDRFLTPGGRGLRPCTTVYQMLPNPDHSRTADDDPEPFRLCRLTTAFLARQVKPWLECCFMYSSFHAAGLVHSLHQWQLLLSFETIF